MGFPAFLMGRDWEIRTFCDLDAALLAVNRPYPVAFGVLQSSRFPGVLAMLRNTTTALATLAAVVHLTGCGERIDGEPEYDEERIAEVQERIEALALVAAAQVEIDGKPFGALESRSFHPDTDYLEIRRLAKEYGLTEAEADILLDRMKAAEKEPPEFELVEVRR